MSLLIMLITAASSAPPDDSGNIPPTTVPFFVDLPLSHGFRLSAVRSSASPVEVGPILVSDAGQPPQWRLAQWGTRFSLESVQEKMLPDGTRLMENEGKRVKILPGGLDGEGVWLEVRGGAEYGDRIRAYGEAWPHLLIEQQLEPRPFHEFSSLAFRVAFRVEKCEAATDKPLDNSLHTAHINAFWTVHNMNSDSADYKNMIWFGLPLYDVRYPIPPGHQALDKGQADATGKFIYTVEGKRFFEKPVLPGQWHVLSCDMLPLLREALKAAQLRGFMTRTRFEDIAATSFNLGWETPGPYDCAITLRSLKLYGLEKAIR